jgi:hypothetical protein
MANLTSVLHQLEQERTRLAAQLESLNSALLSGQRKRTTPKRQNVGYGSRSDRRRSTREMGQGQE